MNTSPGNKFLWGAATSAHQVEGGNKNNDWWKAENEGGLPFKSGQASNHYELYEADFDLAADLSHNAHRFSIEWSRIEPEEGKYDEQALAHYRSVLLYLRSKKIEPVVTLHHFTNPVWFENKDSWEWQGAPDAFNKYAEYVVKNLGEYIDWWITINEPTSYIYQGYITGEWPPFKRNSLSLIKTINNFAAAHKLAYGTIHKHFPLAQVSVSHIMVAYLPHNNNFVNKMAVKLARYSGNHWFLKKIKGAYDYIGLNYYFVRRLQVFPKPKLVLPPAAPVSDMGWEIYPQGFYQVLKEAGKYGKPILITENGLADAGDTRREKFISDHLGMMRKAMDEGVDVVGYLHWSLLDNYEWAEGFAPRFGLIEIDYQTQKRTIRQSAYKYKEIINKWNGS